MEKSYQTTLEFDQILDKLEAYAYTERAKQKICELTPSLSETEVLTALRETTEAKNMLEKCGNPPISALEGMEDLIRTAAQGGCLSAQELEHAAGVLTAVRRLKDYLNQCKPYEIGLAYYEENMDSLDEVREELHDKIRGGRVDDYASKQLKTLRVKLERTDAQMREKADAAMRVHRGCLSDSFSTMRNGHVCIPVKKEYKNKIAGQVLDKSSTGNTLFIEPSAVARCYEELQELKIEEENEERRILYTLTAMLADTAEAMRQNSRTIEKLDFAFAKARLSLEYNGTPPSINTDRRIDLEEGRHPLMAEKESVPLHFKLGDGVRGVIITGPNTGGKTVAIKTVALNCLMAQCGLHVACSRADICLNNRILADIGDGQNLSQNLSTFSAHMIHVLDILKQAGPESLVVLDELGSGTDPAEGMGIAVAVLEELKKSGALFLVTTHYPEVKTYAEKEEGLVNARMTFDKESLQPLYRLVIGEAGESCAFYIARRLGMPGAMLERAAQAAYGEKTELPAQTAGAPENKSGVRRAGGGETAIPEFDPQEELEREPCGKIQKRKAVHHTQQLAEKFHRGDSVMIYPEQKIGIVCTPVDEKGMLCVQLQDKKMQLSHKRVKLQVAAKELYPEEYDFSIVFDSVETRKARHRMERKYVKEAFQCEDE